LYVGVPLPGVDSRTFAALQVVGSLLTGYAGARVDRQPSLQPECSYDLSTRLYVNRGYGSWVLTSDVPPKDAVACLRALMAGVASLHSAPPSAEEIARAREHAPARF